MMRPEPTQFDISPTYRIAAAPRVTLEGARLTIQLDLESVRILKEHGPKAMVEHLTPNIVEILKPPTSS